MDLNGMKGRSLGGKTREKHSMVLNPLYGKIWILEGLLHGFFLGCPSVLRSFVPLKFGGLLVYFLPLWKGFQFLL